MRALAGEQRSVHIFILSAGKYKDGEWTGAEFSPPVEDVMAPRPITPREERRLPDGTYKAGDMKFYASTRNAKYKSGDVVEYNNIRYRIGDISERPEGSFTIYFAKKVYEQ